MNFLHTVLTSINTVLTVGNIWISTKVSALYDQISENEQISQILFKIFDAFILAQMFITDGCKYAYSNSPIIRNVSDFTVHSVSLFTGFMEGYKVEPFQKQWVSTHILIKNNSLFKTKNFIHIEDYQMISTDIGPDCSYNGRIEQGFMYFFNIILSLIVNLTHVLDAIVVMRDGNRYIIRSILSKHDKFHHKPSKHVFLSISYNHPDMKKTIPIEFSEEMYEVGNVVFTPMFIKRCLEYQSMRYIFDERYTLEVIDNEMNMLTLNSQQYGILTENGWEAIDNKTGQNILQNNLHEKSSEHSDEKSSEHSDEKSSEHSDERSSEHLEE